MLVCVCADQKAEVEQEVEGRVQIGESTLSQLVLSFHEQSLCSAVQDSLVESFCHRVYLIEYFLLFLSASMFVLTP